ncbi:cobaltochelatase CobT-related protein [Cobetia sp. L2A1]|uniref:cobaltochelatase CobT-related protein n=1 Tax=Cobetia sp. L2A1 TaxID=2686360 RepID=UPI00131B8AC0|nr:hypothetical protein [Cobetia sp. L2A1]
MTPKAHSDYRHADVTLTGWVRLCGIIADNVSAGEGARHLLVVISDGSPCNSATNMANDEHYLDSHLNQVVAQQTRSGRQAILGLGVGLDLSTY